MRYYLFQIAFILFPLFAVSRDITVIKSIYWEKIHEVIVEGKVERTSLVCDVCSQSSVSNLLPEFSEFFSLASNEYIKSVGFKSLTTQSIDDFTYSKNELQFIDQGTPAVKFYEGIERKEWKGIVRFIPLVQKNGRVEKVTSFEMVIELGYRNAANNLSKGGSPFVNNSVLSSGEWYKIAVNHDAVYKISYKMLQQQGLDLSSIDPRTIKIFGNGGGMLPRKNSDLRSDDLIENAIQVQGESDGKFDKNDYILFYGQGPNKWIYNEAANVFNHVTHQYSDTSYYYIRIGGEIGKRIQNLNVTGTPTTTVNSFDHFDFHEVDKENVLKSGDDWVGEPFDIQLSYNFSFPFPNLEPGTSAYTKTQVVTACRIQSDWTVTAHGSSMNILADYATGGYGERYAWEDFNTMSFSPSGNVVTVNVTYNKPGSVSSAKGYLDYIDVNARRMLILNGTQMLFRDTKSVGNNFASFELSTSKPTVKIWEITDPFNVKQHQTTFSGNKISWVNDATILHTYIAVQAFDSSLSWHGTVANQNLHAEKNYDYIIISHPKFLQAADRLKLIRENEGLRVFVTTPHQIYNEFSSGSQDIVALRDFVRMLYQRATTLADAPKYLLFLGDGSYDNKYRLGGNTNFIPTYESNESYDPPYSYVSDDFYCLLDSNEGFWLPSELMDVGAGRIPVQTLDQANKVIDKIERYMSSQSMGDWRNLLCFVGDDEDGNLHMRQSNELTVGVDTTDKTYNIEKIFIDAYKQLSTPGGERYPDAKEGIKRQVQRGALIVTYTGHGGEIGWAHERILTMDEINNWDNKYNLPLFFTATCEFSRWDDPQRAAGGEVVLLNPKGGGIALLTTVRLVYSSGNQSLALSFYQHVFEKKSGEMQRLGDIYRQVKNSVPGDNTKNFTLLGDPALKLAYPKFNVITDSVNGLHISEIDTVGALGLMEVKGHLEDDNSNKLTNFNGFVYPTVFDKSQSVTTLNNDGVGPFTFNLQNKKLFKGKASITNGEFTFQFIVPKDIAYNYGNGKLSYYAENQMEDASGYSFDFVVGGTNANAAEDKVGPEIKLFLNDETFVYGGITDENPIMIAKIFDQHGINMTGTGIGHDLSIILDGKTDEPIVVNDYYSAETNSYQRGNVNYPFENLSPGPHKLTLKVWDVYNNSSEASIEFIVQEYQNISLNRVLNYPNPFTTNTSFWFEHNQPSTVLDVKIQIFTVSGKIVKSIEQVVENEGYTQNLNNPISWNGRDEFGDKLGRGVYIYKLQVRSRRNGTMAEKIEKLVIL